MLDESKTIYENFSEVAERRGDAPMVYYEDATLSFRDMMSLIHRFAAYYQEIGLKQDDCITLVAPNTPESIASFYAALQLGLHISILHPLTNEENIRKEMKEKGSKLLVTVDLFLRFYDKIIQEKTPILVLDPTDSLSHFKQWGFAFLVARKQLQAAKAHPELPRIRGYHKESDAFVHYDPKEGHIYLGSGGTTGVSKTIVLSDFAFQSILKNGLWFLGDTAEEAEKETMLAVLPMFHGFGLTMGVMAVPFLGGSIYLLAKFHTKPVIKMLKKGHLTTMIGVPAIYEALLKNKHFHGKILQPLKNCWVGGDFISPSLLKRFNERLQEAGSKGMLLEGYGLTETVTVLSVNRISDHRDGSIGRPLPGLDVKILNEENHPLPVGEEGEIAIAGPTLMNGYYRKEDGDPTVLVDGVRYLKSGDIGRMDADGFLYFLSRKKRLIKKKGINIFPLSIEKAVSTVPGVDSCAYLCETYKGYDDTALYFVLAPGADEETTKKAVEQALHANFNKYEWPDFTFVVKELPRTNVMKVDYKALGKDLHAFLEKKYGPLHDGQVCAANGIPQ